jgi:hypothetical protein
MRHLMQGGQLRQLRRFRRAGKGLSIFIYNLNVSTVSTLSTVSATHRDIYGLSVSTVSTASSVLACLAVSLNLYHPLTLSKEAAA